MSVINNIHKTARGLAYALFILSAPTIVSSVYANHQAKNSPKITTISELENIVREEREKLNLGDDIDINVLFTETEGSTSSAKKIGEGKYEIVLAEGQRNRIVLRHELYHVKDGDCDSSFENPVEGISRNGIKKSLKSFFVDQPQADIYATTGLKL